MGHGHSAVAGASSERRGGSRVPDTLNVCRVCTSWIAKGVTCGNPLHFVSLGMKLLKVSIPQMEQIPLKFPILPATQYHDVLRRAADEVRDHELTEPNPDQYQVKRTSVYPAWLIGLIGVMLVGVMILSFVISAGKQAAAIGLIMDNLPSRFNHLSEGWANLSIVFTMLLTEAGTIFFLVCSGIVAKTKSARWILRVFAALCALIAIVANITVTALDTVRDAIVLQWILTIVIPFIVLGLGLILEQLVIDALRSRTESQVLFEQAQREYERLRDDPSKHSAYTSFLADLLFQEMIKVQAARNIIQHLIETDPRYKRVLVSTEHKMQQESGRIDMDIDVSAMLPAGALAAPRIEAHVRRPRSVSRNVSRKPVETEKDKALRWLGEHSDHGLSIQQAADAAGVTKPTMNRAINQQKGV